MFEGTFLHRRYPLRSNVCEVLQWKLNLSSIGQQFKGDYLDSSCNQKDIRMSSIFLPVSLLGLTLSLFSAAVFIRQRQKTSFRTSLIALSVTISCYMLTSSLDFINVLSGACLYWKEPKRHGQVFLGASICLLVDTMLCLRNWCNVLMTAQRTEALLFPLRVNKLLNRRNFCLCLLLLFIVCLPLSLLRSMAEYFIICDGGGGGGGLTFGIVGFPLSEEESRGNPHLDDHRRHFHFLLNEGSWFHPYETYVFFSVQTVAPVALVIAFSLAMSVAMLRRRSAANPTACVAAAAAGNRLSKRNKLRASRTVLCLAAIFTALQMPTFLFSLALASSSSLSEESTAGKIFQFVAELCLLLDSILNIFVYAYFVPDFRLCCSRAWRSVVGGAGGGGGGGGGGRRATATLAGATAEEARRPLRSCRQLPVQGAAEKAVKTQED